ncbi:hypothetical protein K438DRAFT_2021305 [Mycena galopus ATCC 62051]|nr:hypothetical protein K438DRAFT_2021305 [Mycena galopus ATCC 62051]
MMRMYDDGLDVLASAAARTAPASADPPRTPLAPRNPNGTDYPFTDYSLSTPGYDFDTSNFGAGFLYTPTYDGNHFPGYPPSSSPTGFCDYGLKRPSSPTFPNSSPKRTHSETVDHGYAAPTSVPVPAGPTPPSLAPQPPKRRGRPPKTQPILPSAVTTLFPMPVVEVKPAAPLVNKGNWEDEELTAFYEHCLGSDSDSNFEKITKSSNKCWAKFVGKVGIARDQKHMKGQWETSSALYKLHPDWDSPKDVDGFIASRAARGIEVDGLTAKKVRKWIKLGWYKLWHDRFGENPRADREVARSSVGDLSDIESDLHNTDDENDLDDIEVIEKPRPTAPPSTKSTKKSEKSVASDPRKAKPSAWSRSKPVSHTHSNKVKKEDRLQLLSNYFEKRVQVDEAAVQIQKSHHQNREFLICRDEDHLA